MRLRAIIWILLFGTLLAFAPAWAEDEAEQKLHLEAYADFDYDTNASQQPSGADSQVASGQGSLVLTQGLRAEYNFSPSTPFDMQLKYELFQNFYTRISYINTMMHTFTLNPSYSFGFGESRNIKFWLPVAYNYTDVGSDKYFTSLIFKPNIFHRFTENMGYSAELRLIRLFGWVPQYFAKLYDYTSLGIGGSVGLYYFLGDTGGYLQARLSYDYVGAVGINNDHSGYSLLLSGEYPLTARLNALLYLDLALRPYDHIFQEFPAAIYGSPENYPKRLDKILTFGALLECNIYKGLFASAHYYYTRWDSNIALYDYTSHLFGGELTYRY